MYQEIQILLTELEFQFGTPGEENRSLRVISSTIEDNTSIVFKQL